MTTQDSRAEDTDRDEAIVRNAPPQAQMTGEGVEEGMEDGVVGGRSELAELEAAHREIDSTSGYVGAEGRSQSGAIGEEGSPEE